VFQVLIWYPFPHPAIPNLVAIPTDRFRRIQRIALFSQARRGHRRTPYKFKFIVLILLHHGATDAVILSVQADGVLIVVRSAKRPRELSLARATCSIASSANPRRCSQCRGCSAPDYYTPYRYYPYSYGYGPQEAAEAPHEEDSESIAARVSRDRDDDSQPLRRPFALSDHRRRRFYWFTPRRAPLDAATASFC